MPNPLYFVTSNDYKFHEFNRLFSARSVELKRFSFVVEEVQALDIQQIVRQKVIRAYERLNRPLMVDHSGLAMSALNGLPQGLNNQFWDLLQDRVCDLAKRAGDTAAEIIVVLGFCDGQRILLVEHREVGSMASAPAICGSFHLDRVFIPKGASQTLAEMTDTERDKWSHRTKVADKAIQKLRGTPMGLQLGLHP